jgi:hypothetical protein
MTCKLLGRRTLVQIAVVFTFCLALSPQQSHAGWLRRLLSRSQSKSCSLPCKEAAPVCCGARRECRVLVQDVSETPAVAARTDPQPEAKEHAESKSETANEGWVSLFDGKTIDGWRETEFGGEGDVYVENGSIILGFGAPLTGITYKGSPPTTDYEIRLEAMRVEGSDFFCGLTFPVADSHCSFIVGGWGGGVIGLSSLDGEDASENETTNYMKFEKKKWYKIRVRVTPDMIDAWIDDYQFVDSEITDRTVSIRPEVDLSRPLGIATFDTQAAIRNIQLRLLSDRKSRPSAPRSKETAVP